MESFNIFINTGKTKRNRSFVSIKCVVCGKHIYRRIDVLKKCPLHRCGICTKKLKSLKGKDNPNWKERKKCVDCGVELVHKGNRPYKRCKNCFDKYNSGENHWNWQNGKSAENTIIRNSKKYKLWAEAVKKRDNYTCQICFKRGCYLHSDHIKPFSLYPNLRFDVSNGRTLCKDCHYRYGWSLFKKRNPRKGAAQGTHSKMVYCINTNKVYDSYTNAMSALGISRQAISRSVKKGMPTRGYLFQEFNEELLIF